MNQVKSVLAAALLAAASASPARGVELKVSRDALERTLKAQLFNGPSGCYYLKGSSQTSCAIYAEDPRVTFLQDRILVRVKTHTRALERRYTGPASASPLRRLQRFRSRPPEKARPWDFAMPGWSASASSMN
jgi:hypothetical protein